MPDIIATVRPGVVSNNLKVIEVSGLEKFDSTTTKKSNITLVVDVSGSMCNVINTVSLACNKVLDKLGDRANITILTFNHECCVYTDRPVCFRAGGGTSFEHAFKMLNNTFNKNNPASVLFLTDGRDGSSMYIDMEMRRFKEFYKTVSVIGFTSSHDTVMLNKIVNNGVFVYASNSDDITSAYEKVTPFLNVGDVFTLETISGKKIPLVDNVGCLGGDGGEINGIKILVNDKVVGDVCVTQEGVPSIQTMEVEIDYICEGIRNELKDVADKLQTDSIGLEGVKDVYNSVLAKIDAMESPMRKLRVFDPLRKATLQRTSALRQSANTFYTSIRQIIDSNRRVCNSDLAKLYNITYKDTVNNSRQRKLDKRVVKNNGLVESVMTNARLAADTLGELPSEPEIKCFMSTANWDELARDADCVCLALDITRSTNTGLDPTLLTIKAVGPSFISVEEYFKSTTYALDHTQYPSEVHGGLDRGNGQVVPGVARESITGAMPLYINEEHWSVAKHWNKLVMGWMTCLDILGYASVQATTIPFMVLKKLRETLPNSDLVGLVESTCQAVLRDFKVDVAGMVRAFEESPVGRFRDVISSLDVFELQVEMAGLVVDPVAMMEERVRRQGSYLEKPLAWFGVDESLIDNALSEYVPGGEVPKVNPGVVIAGINMEHHRNKFNEHGGLLGWNQWLWMVYQCRVLMSTTSNARQLCESGSYINPKDVTSMDQLHKMVVSEFEKTLFNECSVLDSAAMIDRVSNFVNAKTMIVATSLLGMGRHVFDGSIKKIKEYMRSLSKEEFLAIPFFKEKMELCREPHMFIVGPNIWSPGRGNQVFCATHPAKGYKILHHL